MDNPSRFSVVLYPFLDIFFAGSRRAIFSKLYPRLSQKDFLARRVIHFNFECDCKKWAGRARIVRIVKKKNCEGKKKEKVEVKKEKSWKVDCVKERSCQKTGHSIRSDNQSESCKRYFNKSRKTIKVTKKNDLKLLFFGCEKRRLNGL